MNNSKKNLSLNQNDNYITKLKELFEYYCQYGERLNSRILKSHAYIKLFRESGIMDKKLDTTRLEIIYKSINKNNQMNFDQFLNSLLKIASYKYSLTEKKDIKNGTQKIILEYLYPLYYTINNNISQSKDLNNINTNNSSNNLNNTSFENIIYSDTFKQILIQVIPILFDIYRAYFTNEISISDDFIYIKNTSIKNYFTLIKNLEIIPYLLSNSTCYQIYKYETTNKTADESIKNNQNFYFEICQKIDFLNMNSYEHSNKNIFGKYFIFFKFVRALIKMSQITFDKIYNSNKILSEKLTPEEMFILFLQKIEQSEGFGNFTKINNISHNYKTSSIIPNNFRIKFGIKKEDENDNKNKEIIDNNNKDEEKIDINKNIEQYEPKYINYINEVYGKDLLSLYKTMVNFGDQFNFQYMKSKAFFKFLSDSNLIKNKQNNFGIKLNEIDIFFIKMCLLMKNNEKLLIKEKKSNNNLNKNVTVNVSYGEIDYPTFIISIEILSQYLFSNLSTKQAIDKLIVEFILNGKDLKRNNKINEIEQKIEHLKELQNNEEIISFLQMIHKAFYPLFSFYTKENEGLMPLQTFMKFTKDFEIFPYLIGKAKLNSLFNAIAQYSSFVKKNESFIEHSLFVDLIALMALEMIYPEPEPSPIEKMLIFIEKISQSGGVGKITMRTGNNRIGNCANFIDVFKNVYPGYFEENKEFDEDNDKDDFESLMKSNNDNDMDSGNEDINSNEIFNEKEDDTNNNINKNDNENENEMLNNDLQHQ